jgi:NO-binding membrane sensor protein with MHYT domain
MRCTPYAHPLHDIVKALSEVTIFLVLLSAMLMKPPVVSKQKDRLGEATAATVLVMAILMMYFTARAAKKLMGEILDEMKGLKERIAVSNPMAEPMSPKVVGNDGDGAD